MFKISQSSTYFWPVTVNIPTDGGKHEKATFDAEFKRLPQSRLDELREQLEKGEVTDFSLAKEVLVGWKGVTDEGQEIQFSESNRDRMFEIPTVATSVVMALFDSLAGAKRKN